MTDVRLHIDGYPDSDSEERAELAWRLEQDLRAADIENVSRPATDAPEGAKGGALAWAELIVTLAGTVPSFLPAFLGWARRHPGASITLEIDGDKLTVDNASESERRRLVEAFLARHGDD
jgi:hypothetical protein